MKLNWFRFSKSFSKIEHLALIEIGSMLTQFLPSYVAMLEHVFSFAMDSEDWGCPTFWRGFKAILELELELDHYLHTL